MYSATNLISALKLKIKNMKILRAQQDTYFFSISFLVSCNLVSIMSIKIMNFLQSNYFYKIVLLSILLIFFNLESKELAKFNDWSAFAEGKVKNLACMVMVET